jgi:hypothetical protein
MALKDKIVWGIDVSRYLRMLDDAKIPPKSDKLISTWKWEIPSSANRVATRYYLSEQKIEAAKYAREMVDAVLDQFYGSWRENAITDLGTKDPTWWHAHSSWMFHFQESLCWALAIGDWDAAKKIAEYPADKCMVDPTATKEDKAAYLTIACFFRGEPTENYRHHFHEISSGKKEKPKFIAKVIESLQMKDAAKFQESLEAYLNYFRKREFRKNSLDKLFCYDGTTLMNIGKQEGLEFKIPQSAEDYLIQLES